MIIPLGTPSEGPKGFVYWFLKKTDHGSWAIKLDHEKRPLSMPTSWSMMYTGPKCHQLLLSCSILIVTCNVVSPTLNVNPTLFIILCEFNFLRGRGYIYIVLQILYTVTYQVIFIQISIIHDNISSPSFWQENIGFCAMDELIHHPWTYLFTCS